MIVIKSVLHLSKDALLNPVLYIINLLFSIF